MSQASRRHIPAYCHTLGFAPTPSDRSISYFDIRLDVADRLPEGAERTGIYIYTSPPSSGISGPESVRISHPLGLGGPISCSFTNLAETLQPIIEMYGLPWPAEDVGKPWVPVEGVQVPPMAGRLLAGTTEVLALTGAAS